MRAHGASCVRGIAVTNNGDGAMASQQNGSADQMTRYSTHHAPRALAAAMAIFVLGSASCGGSGDTKTEVAQTAAAPAAAVGTPGGSDGASIFLRCAACHQPTGLGLPGTFPPLAGSEIANGPAEIPIRIVLKGLAGPITVHGATFNGVMPAYGTGVELSDAEVATVLTWVRSQWGNTGSAVTPEQVAKERAAVKDKVGSWSAAELGLKP